MKKANPNYYLIVLVTIAMSMTAGSAAIGGTCDMTIESRLYEQSYSMHDYGRAAVSGNRMYVQFAGVMYDDSQLYTLLQVYDISNPANPSMLGETNSDELANLHQIAAFGTTLVGSHTNGSQVRTYNAADPYNIVHVGTLGIFAYGFEKANGLLYVDSVNSLHIVDVSDPATPRSIGSVDTFGGVEYFGVKGDLVAYTSNYQGAKLQLIDVSDPTNPTLISTTLLTNTDDPGKPTIIGNTVIIPQGNSMEFYNITNRLLPTRIATLSTTQSVHLTQSAGVVCYGITNQYDASSNRELYAIDVSVPAAPVISDTLTLFGIKAGAKSLTLSGSLAIVCNGDSFSHSAGLTIANVGSCSILPNILQGPGSVWGYDHDMPLELTVAGTGATSYEWFNNYGRISDDAIYSGADSATLTIKAVHSATGPYRVRLSNDDGNETSQSAVVGIIETSPADINIDGIVNLSDLALLASDWLASSIPQ
jgi:hypothetical protein